MEKVRNSSTADCFANVVDESCRYTRGSENTKKSNHILDTRWDLVRPME